MEYLDAMFAGEPEAERFQRTNSNAVKYFGFSLTPDP
jgi:hypothetical protein